MLCEFVDGSKTMVEMAAVSNATGLIPDIRGMHGPKCNIKDLTKVFCRKDQGGILDKEGVVDYGIGDINPGVFVIVTTEHPRLIEGLVQRDMGNGPQLPSFQAVPPLQHRDSNNGRTGGNFTASPLPIPLKKLVSECITIAKKDLKAGEALDGIGEYCYRASIELAGTAKEGKMLPIGLAKGAKLLCDVKKDSVITYDMVELDNNSVTAAVEKDSGSDGIAAG